MGKELDASEGKEAQVALDKELQAVAQKGVLPGFAVSVFTKDTVLFQSGYGFADLDAKRPFTPDNTQIIASITKTLVGVALMQLVERNKISLDTPINDILPYRVSNPYFPYDVITLRHLASHTSTITGTKNSDKGYRFAAPLRLENFSGQYKEAYRPLLEVYNKTEDLSMKEFLSRKLRKDGIWYETELFKNERPGVSYHYSNLGVALLAHCLEIKTGIPFDTFSEENILRPLGMDNSSWLYNEGNPNQHVTYYFEYGMELPNYHIITYPDGGLFSSVADMTNFLQEIIKCHKGEGKLLRKETTHLMISKQFEGEELTEGICWDLSFEGLVGHPGNDFGTSTLMYFNPSTGIGRILFTNVSTENESQEDAFYSIFNALFAYDLTQSKE